MVASPIYHVALGRQVYRPRGLSRHNPSVIVKIMVQTTVTQIRLTTRLPGTYVSGVEITDVNLEKAYECSLSDWTL